MVNLNKSTPRHRLEDKLRNLSWDDLNDLASNLFLIKNMSGFRQARAELVARVQMAAAPGVN